jgi:ABC-type multidrug transport system fused ATPase/permease subunit
MKVFKLLMWPFLTRHWRGITGVVALGFVHSCCTLLIPLSIGRYMDLLFEVETNKGKALALVGIRLPNSLMAFFIFFGLLLLAKLLTGWAGQYLANCHADRYVSQLRLQLFSRHLAARAAGDPVVPAALTAYSSDMQTQQRWLVKGVIGLAKNLLFLLVALYILFVLQPILSGIVLLLLPLVIWLHVILNQRLKPKFKQRRRRQAALFGFVSAQLLGETIPEKNANGLLEQKSLQWQQAGKGYHKNASLLHYLPPLSLYLMLGLLLLVMALTPNGLLLNSSDTLTYVLLLMMVMPAFRSIVGVQKTWMQAGVSAQKFLKNV